MAKTLQFGDENSADIRLHLIGSSGQECREGPLLVHSQVLKRAEHFETKLSERSSSEKGPFEIKVTICHSVKNYVKCIQLMYSYHQDQRFCFSGVDDALHILPVASQIMFHDCIKSCMLYLNAVRWSPEQKATLGALLTSLQIDILPDLAARLGMTQSKSESEHTEMVKESLQELLSMTLNESRYRHTAQICLLDYFEADASLAVKDVCRSILLKEFNEDVERIKSENENIKLDCSRLSWLVGVIKKCDGKLFDTVVKLFCEDTNLRNSISTGVVNAVNLYPPRNAIYDILCDQFLKAIGNGDTVTPTTFRVCFLTNWIDIMVTIAVAQKTLGILEHGIIGVGETLPLVEKKRIYNIWKDTLIRHSEGTSRAFNWWIEKMHEAITMDKIM